MTAYVIPVLPAQSQAISALLGTSVYTLKIVWNWLPLPGTWILDIGDATGPLVQGIPLVTGEDLLAQFGYLNIGGDGGGGYLFVGAANDVVTPPTYDSLGVSCNLYWQPR